MTKKMTKKDMFTAMLNKYAFTADERAFIEHELELLNRKSASGERKPTATQVANAGIKDSIVAFMEENPNRIFTISEIVKECPECQELTGQKVSALISQLIKENKVERIEEKRKAYFKIVQ